MKRGSARSTVPFDMESENREDDDDGGSESDSLDGLKKIPTLFRLFALLPFLLTTLESHMIEGTPTNTDSQRVNKLRRIKLTGDF
jgi:hypothetical protein